MPDDHECGLFECGVILDDHGDRPPIIGIVLPDNASCCGGHGHCNVWKVTLECADGINKALGFSIDQARKLRENGAH